MSDGRETLAGYLIEKTRPMWSPEKTKVTAMTEGIAFLGWHHRHRLQQKKAFTSETNILLFLERLSFGRLSRCCP
ncbi:MULTISPECIES: hypothetical protein [unclassified Rhizobium]|uniref:hypothetical protein n=1 Tax=unclassified Rhizobium TaxID=2613769 RepID=UPI001ADC50D6|nr:MULTISPECIES: hypothetical protein [unclassified Rhizobium]MBO9099505.1 hypothetical protein [Rhizobium sp. L58/93]QXZ87013.1 hypothetical protein J5287_20700 [Rhizobium sp. K1/93]QXZ92953.1 hypothetical protein J5280_20195 [Rhizobium sp. K15/93]